MISNTTCKLLKLLSKRLKKSLFKEQSKKGTFAISMASGEAQWLPTSYEKPERNEAPAPTDGGRWDNIEKQASKAEEKLGATSIYGPM